MTNKMLSLHFVIYCIITFSLAVLIVLIFSACSPLTKIQHDIKTTYTPQYNIFDSPIATPYKDELQKGQDGALIIADGTSALLHRLAFIQMAQKNIDIQTYIYKNELTSKLLIHELLAAAERGVKIRILIDDNGITNDLYDLIQLDNHPNVEVRIFNPYFFRFTILRALEAPFDFSRINKRMHNKLFIFDDTALIMGGRNIGDEYFDNASVNFTDMDLLFIGNITKDSRINFEEFWNYERSIPLKYFPSKSKLKKYHKRTLKEQAKAYNINEKQWLEYRADIESFKEKYLNKQLKMSFGEGIFLADLPQKVDIHNADSKTLILDALSYYLNYAKDSIIISSSYLVPGNASMEFWQDFLNRGIKIQILTNSLASIDVVPVYSHWEHYRDALAKMGIEVYEYTNLDTTKARLKDKAKFYNTKKARVSLHSKSMIIDSNIIAVGSFNLDYRSAMLNTESIVFFKSQQLASELKKISQEQMEQSYRILYDSKTKKCVWELKVDNDVEIFNKPPNTSFWLRLYKNVAKILPEKLF